MIVAVAVAVVAYAALTLLRDLVVLRRATARARMTRRLLDGIRSAQFSGAGRCWDCGKRAVHSICESCGEARR